MVWPEDREFLSDLLSNDNLLLLPTDTVWGIIADATSETAIQRVIHLKGGQPQRGLVILAADLNMLKAVVPDVHPRLETLLTLHRRSLTVLYHQTQGLPQRLCGSQGEWAIRICLDPVLAPLIQHFGRPIVGTAACRYDQDIPLHFGEIQSDILEGVDFVAKWRRHEKTGQVPSAMVRLDERYELDFVRQ